MIFVPALFVNFYATRLFDARRKLENFSRNKKFREVENLEKEQNSWILPRFSLKTVSYLSSTLLRTLGRQEMEEEAAGNFLFFSTWIAFNSLN